MFASNQANDLYKEQQERHNEEFRKQLQKDLIAAINSGNLVKLKGILAIPGVELNSKYDSSLELAFKCSPFKPEIIIELINAGADIQKKFHNPKVSNNNISCLELVCYLTEDVALICLVLRKIAFLDPDNILIASVMRKFESHKEILVLTLILQEAVLRNDHCLIKNIFKIKSDLDCTAETLRAYLNDTQLTPAQIRHAQMGVSYLAAKHYISFDQGVELKRVITNKPAVQPSFVASFPKP